MEVMWALFLCVVLYVITIIKLLSRKPVHGGGLPPTPPSSVPLLGHLHLLRHLPHRSLAELSQKHGPLLLIRLGSAPCLLVSSPSLAKQILLTHDSSFCDRPRYEAASRILWNSSLLSFLQYGPRWRLVRRLYTHHILTSHRVATFTHVRNDEIACMLDHVAAHQLSSVEVPVSKLVFLCAGNSITRMLFSRKCFDLASSNLDTHFRDLILELSALMESPIIGDVIPALGWIDGLRGYRKRMDNLQKDMDAFFTSIITAKQAESYVKAGTNPEGDFLDLLLEMEARDEIDMVTVKAGITDLMLGGTETGTTVLEWTMSELVMNPWVMEKLQRELDTKVNPSKRQVEEEDLDGLEYMKAVIKESMRLHPPLPLLVPRQSRETCEVGGYLIPEKTRVIINAWGIGRDPLVWEKAEVYNPDRFMSGGAAQHVDVRGQQFEFLPFGSGRRGCPGINLGMLMIQLILANLVRNFEWSLHEESSCRVVEGGNNDKDVLYGYGKLDMMEKAGITVGRKVPLMLLAKPRISTPPPSFNV